MQKERDNMESLNGPWILHDPNVPDMAFNSEAESLEAAQNAIEQYLDGDEWSHEVKDLRITRDGITTHRPIEIPLPTPDDVLEAMEDDSECPPPCDYYCDYEMRRVTPKP